MHRESSDQAKDNTLQIEGLKDKGTTLNCTPNPAKSGKEVISLINFNPKIKKKNFINSPRSREALKSLGIEDHELLIKRKEDFINEQIPPQFKNDKDEYISLKLAFYDRARQNRLRLCLAEREKLVQKSSKYLNEESHFPSITEKTPNTTIDSERLNKSVMTYNESSKKQLDRLRRKQEKDIQFLLEKEEQIEEMELKNQMKNMKLQQIEHMKQVEFERKKKEGEAYAVRRRIVKELEEAKMLEIERELSEKRQAQEKKWKERFDQLDQRRKEDMEQKEISRKIKLLDLSHRVEENEKRRYNSAISKRMFLERKFEHNQSLLLGQKEERARQGKLAQEDFQKRIKMIAEMQARERENSEKKFIERMQRNDEMRQVLGERKQSEIEVKKMKSEARTREAKLIRERLYTQEIERKSSFLINLDKAEQNRLYLQTEMAERRRYRAAQEEEREAEAKRRVEEQNARLAHKNDVILQKLYKNMQQAEQQKSKIMAANKYNSMLEYIKEEEAKENVSRQAKALDYQKEKLNEKMLNHSLRHEQMEQERQLLRKEKESIEKQFQLEKHHLHQNFEKEQKRLLANSFSHHNKSRLATNESSKILTPAPLSSKRMRLSRINVESNPELSIISQPKQDKRSLTLNKDSSELELTTTQDRPDLNNSLIPIPGETSVSKEKSSKPDLNNSLIPIPEKVTKEKYVRPAGRIKPKLPHTRVSITEGSDRSESPPMKKFVENKHSLFRSESHVNHLSAEEDALLPYDKKTLIFVMKQMNKDFLAILDTEMEGNKNENDFNISAKKVLRVAKKQTEELDIIRKNSNHLKLNNLRRKKV